MADPFAAGLGTLFAGPGAVAAVYDDGEGAKPIRVIHEKPDVVAGFAGRDDTILASNVFRIQAVDVAEPAIGDLVTVEAGTFSLSSDPQLDTQGRRWVCPAEPV